MNLDMPSEESSLRVLILEDEAPLRTALERSIKNMGYETESAGSISEAWAMAAQQEYDLAVMDLKLPDGDGLDFFERLHERWPETQGVVLTGFGSLATAQRAFKLDTVDFLSKPFLLSDLEEALQRAAQRRFKLSSTTSRAEHASPGPPESHGKNPHRLEDLEQEQILSTLRQHHGNRAKTARELGISLRTLYYRLSTYKARGIEIDFT